MVKQDEGGNNGSSRFLSNPFLVCATVIFLGCVARLIYLKASTVWYDEALSIYYAEQSIPVMVGMVRQDVGEPLYYVFLKGWISLFGNSQMACASMSVFFSVVNLFLIFYLCKMISNNRAALLSVIILAFNPVALHNSTNIRFYAFLNTLVLLSYILLFFVANKKSNNASIVSYIAIVLLGLHTHTYFQFVCFSQAMIGLLFYRESIKQFLFVYGIIGVLYLPWFFLVLLYQIRHTVGTGMPPIENGIFGAIYLFGRSISGLLFHNNLLGMLGTVIVLLSFCITLIGVIALNRHTSSVDTKWRYVLILLIAYGFSIGTPILISVIKPIYLPGRYDYIGLSVIVIAVAIAISNLSDRLSTRRSAYGSIGTVFIISFAQMLPNAKFEVLGQFDSDRQSVIWAKEHITPNTAVVFTGLGFIAPNYFLTQMEVDYKAQYFLPSEVSLGTPVFWPANYSGKELVIAEESEELVHRLNSENLDRICVFYDDAEGLLAPLNSVLRREFVVEEEFIVPKHTWGAVYDKVFILERKK